jgi:AraC-like DNA-binding protein
VLSPAEIGRLSRARAILRTTGEDCPRIGRLARTTGLSPYHFIRRFRAVFGETPHRLRSRARMERAQELLLTTELSITEISLCVGFSSLGSFSARFAREVGVSPSRYRASGSPARPESFSCFGLMAGSGPGG